MVPRALTHEIKLPTSATNENCSQSGCRTLSTIFLHSLMQRLQPQPLVRDCFTTERENKSRDTRSLCFLFNPPQVDAVRSPLQTTPLEDRFSAIPARGSSPSGSGSAMVLLSL